MSDNVPMQDIFIYLFIYLFIYYEMDTEYFELAVIP